MKTRPFYNKIKSTVDSRETYVLGRKKIICQNRYIGTSEIARLFSNIHYSEIREIMKSLIKQNLVKWSWRHSKYYIIE